MFNKFMLAFLVFFSANICLAQVIDPAVVSIEDGTSLGIMDIIDILSQLVLVLSILATIILRFLPKDYTATFSGIVGKILSLLHWLPTFGINPRTKAMEAALQDALAQLEELKAKNGGK